MIRYFEVNFNVKINSGAKPLSLSEQEQWNKLSNEEKFNDTFGKLPLMLIGYIVEASFIVALVLFMLQIFGVTEFIP